VDTQNLPLAGDENDVLSFANDLIRPDQLQPIQDTTGLRRPTESELKEMVTTFLTEARTNQEEMAPKDHELLCESILF
jgi:hypothetical protein